MNNVGPQAPSLFYILSQITLLQYPVLRMDLQRMPRLQSRL